jgi:hypothetical protein
MKMAKKATVRLFLPGESPNIHHFKAMLRLGKKYLMPRYYNSAVKLLSQDVAQTLQEWDRIRDTDPNFLEWTEALEIDAANIARTTGATVLLPALLCEMRLSAKEVIYGVKRRDGTMAQLSLENQVALLEGKEKLAKKTDKCSS